MIFSRAPFIAGGALFDGVPASDEEAYWINEDNNTVCTDTGDLTITSYTQTYWADDRNFDLCTDLGETVLAFHLTP